MKIDTNKSGSPASRWFKNALCIGMVMALSMSMGTAYADSDGRKDRSEDRKEKHEKHKGKGKNGNIMTPFARIAKLKVVKGKRGEIDYEATYDKAGAVALAIATYVDGVDDITESGFPANWIVGGMEGGSTLEEAILKIPSPEFIDPENEELGVKFVNVMDLCNAYYAKQALGVAPIAGTDTKVVNGYSHATALPCEISTWNDDEHIYVDMLDPNAIFSIFFTDVLVSEDMQDADFAEAISALPVAVKSEIKTVVYNALDANGYKYKATDKKLGPKYKSVEDIFEVVAASPNVSPYMHIAYTKSDGTAFADNDAEVVAQAIINAMSIHGEDGAGTHDPELESLLSANSKWRSARHEPLGLPGKPEKNWVIEACSPTYAKMAMGTGMHHATALPCEIAVQRVDRDGNDSTESLVISYLDPYFMFGAMFADMSDEEKDALGDVPGYIISDLQYIVQFALDESDTELSKGVQFWYTMLP